MIATGEMQQQGGHCRHPGGEGKSAGASLEFCECSFQDITGWIAATGIIVTGTLSDSRMPIGGTGINRKADPSGVIVSTNPDLHTSGSLVVK